MVKAKNTRKRIGIGEISEEEIYLKSTGLSASGINTFINDGPEVFIKHASEDTDATVLGSAIHCLRYLPEEFKDKFFVIKERVEGTMGLYIQTLAEGKVTGQAERVIKEVAYIASRFKWPKTRVEKTFSENKLFVDYYEALVSSNGRHVLSREEEETAGSCARALVEHKAVQEISSRSEGEIWVERPIVWTIDCPTGPVVCKSKPDLVHIDHENRIITVEDTKTTSKSKRGWEEIIKNRGYYRQIAFYCGAVERKLWQDGRDVTPLYNKRYSWNANISMVETERNHSVEVYNFDDKTLNRAFSECIDTASEIEWHRKNNLWKHTRDYYEGDGTIKLQIYK